MAYITYQDDVEVDSGIGGSLRRLFVGNGGRDSGSGNGGSDGSSGQGDVREVLEAVLKVLSMVFFVVLLIVVVLVHKRNPTIANTTVKSSFGKIEYTTPYKNILYENFGFVNEPRLKLPLKTVDGYKKVTFLLDSGAVVSALPMQAAEDVGIDFENTKRITLQGFSGIPTFAYFGNITVKIGDRDFSFPAVFTESSDTTYILGRKGFFDQFTIKFNSENKTVTITTKERK